MSDAEKRRNDDLAKGYELAIHIVTGLYPNVDPNLLRKLLFDIALGRASAFNSPEEELASVEGRLGPMSEERRRSFLELFENRRAIDRTSQEIAVAILSASTLLPQ